MTETAVLSSPGPEAPASSRPASSARAIAAYLTALRGLVDQVNAPRQQWLRGFGQLLRDAQRAERDVAELAAQAGQIGQEHRLLFAATRERLQELTPPDAAEPCHLAVVVWLDKQIAACDAMIEIGASRELSHLRAVHGLFADARVDMRRFSAEYAALVQAVRKSVADLQAKRSAQPKKARWPFARAARQP